MLMTPQEGQAWIRRASLAGHTETVKTVKVNNYGVVLVTMQGRPSLMTLDEFHQAYAWNGPALEFKV